MNDLPSPLEENGSTRQDSSNPGVEFPRENDLPEDFTPLVRPDDLASSSRARRRRARRTLIPPGDDERAALLEDLSRKSFPSVEFFLFALFSGVLLGAGYLLDSHALLLLGLLVAPLSTPWVGMSLAVATGGWRFFFLTLSSLAMAFMLAFLSSALVGLLNKVVEFSRFSRAADHARLWPTDLLIVILGAVLMVLALVRTGRKLIIPSIMLAYAFFLPIAAAGFAWGAGLPGIWPDGISVFLTYFALATFVGCIVLAAQRFKPPKASGYILLVFISVLCLAVLAVFTGLAGWFIERAMPEVSRYTPTPLGLVSPTPGLPPSPTSGAPTRTSTFLPTQQPSSSPTITPASSFAIVSADTGGGASVRSEPGGGYIMTTVINGTLVEVLSQVRAVGSIMWTLIRTQEGIEGWVLQAVLSPVGTPTLTLTP